jgi:hypothetical protein
VSANLKLKLVSGLLGSFLAIGLVIGITGYERSMATTPNSSATSTMNNPLTTTDGPLAEVNIPNSIARLAPSLEKFQPQIQIISPQPDQILTDDLVNVKLNVKDLPLFKSPELGLGNHLHVILDKQNYQGVVDLTQPLVFKNLAPGTHTLRVFASRPWHESFKNPGAYAQTTFHVLTKTAENNPDPQLPLLTYSRPTGTYGVEPIMLDYYLTNAAAHVAAQGSSEQIPDWRIRATVNDQRFIIDRWTPIYLQGFKQGKNWVRLELIDDRGNPIPNVYNDTLSIFTYDPQAKDPLTKLIKGEIDPDLARTLVNPNYTAAKPIPLPAPIAVPTPVIPTPVQSPAIVTPPIPVVKPLPSPVVLAPQLSPSPSPVAPSPQPITIPSPIVAPPQPVANPSPIIVPTPQPLAKPAPSAIASPSPIVMATPQPAISPSPVVPTPQPLPIPLPVVLVPAQPNPTPVQIPAPTPIPTPIAGVERNQPTDSKPAQPQTATAPIPAATVPTPAPVATPTPRSNPTPIGSIPQPLPNQIETKVPTPSPTADSQPNQVPFEPATSIRQSPAAAPVPQLPPLSSQNPISSPTMASNPQLEAPAQPAWQQKAIELIQFAGVKIRAFTNTIPAKAQRFGQNVQIWAGRAIDTMRSWQNNGDNGVG